MKLREYVEQKLEALKLPARLEFELDDGTTIELTHQWLWSDKVQAAVNRAQSDTDKAKAILGAQEYKRLIAGGGSSNQLMFAVEMMKRPQPADGESESDPKDS
jgi:hypothetical protein